MEFCRTEINNSMLSLQTLNGQQNLSTRKRTISSSFLFIFQEFERWWGEPREAYDMYRQLTGKKLNNSDKMES